MTAAPHPPGTSAPGVARRQSRAATSAVSRSASPEAEQRGAPPEPGQPRLWPVARPLQRSLHAAGHARTPPPDLGPPWPRRPPVGMVRVPLATDPSVCPCAHTCRPPEAARPSGRSPRGVAADRLSLLLSPNGSSFRPGVRAQAPPQTRRPRPLSRARQDWSQPTRLKRRGPPLTVRNAPRPRGLAHTRRGKGRVHARTRPWARISVKTGASGPAHDFLDFGLPHPVDASRGRSWPSRAPGLGKDT